MPTTPLRQYISKQSILTSVLPFLLLALLGLFLLWPQMNYDIESRQRELTGSVSSQVNSYLTAAMTTVRGSAQILRDKQTGGHVQMILKAQLAASDFISTIYATDRYGRITSVEQPNSTEARRKELQQIDLSHNSFFKKALQSKTPLWSETFLSLISGRLSVAYAVPVNNGIYFGEMSLDQLTLFLKALSDKTGTLILVADNTGRVITGQDERFAGQQINISNIPIVKSGIRSESVVTGRFEFEGHSMIGGMTGIPAADWGVLVAQPVESAYHTVWVTACIATAGLITALLSGILLALFTAGKLTNGFEQLAAHARRAAKEETSIPWPESDITEVQQLAEDLSQMADTLKIRGNQLLAAKEYSENLIKAANMIIISLDRSGCVTMMNSTAELITGYTLAELKGRSWFETVTPRGILPEAVEESELIQKRQCRDTFENTILAKNGDRRIINWHNNPIIENGEVVGTISFGSDITEQRILERQLRQSQKMESIGRLAGGVAHDFNNKLTVILGYAEMLRMEVPEESSLWQDLNEISKAAEHSREITAQLLAFSRQQIISPKPVNLNSVIMDMQRTLPRLIGEDIILTPILGDQLWVTRIDPTQLDQIIMNLSVNARDAMPDGGELKISTRNTTIDEFYCHEHIEAAPGDYVMLSIQDNGCGMDPETQKHIFEPFFTTKQIGKGTGLGLATIYGIVTQNNGFINLYSEPGTGTIFKIFLPRLTGEVLPESRSAAANSSGSGNILLVEDDITVRKMTKTMLEQIGYTVTATEDSQQAISLCKDFKKEIDLIITDVIMPGMNGKEMIDAIEKIRPEVKVLYMSGYTSEIISQKGVVAEDMHFIQKPFDMNSLNSKIREVLT